MPVLPFFIVGADLCVCPDNRRGTLQRAPTQWLYPHAIDFYFLIIKDYINKKYLIFIRGTDTIRENKREILDRLEFSIPKV